MPSIDKGPRVGTDLTKGPVMRTLIAFSSSMILALIVQQLYSILNLIVIGWFADSVGTVSVSVGSEMSDLILPIATSFATGGQIYIAQLAGADEVKKIKSAIGTLISIMLLISIFALTVIILFTNPILRALNCPSEAHAQAAVYMIITALGMPFIFGYNALCGVLRGLGESKWPLIFIIIAAVVNFLLNILLIAIAHMEAAGTAIATVAAQAASFIAASFYVYKRREQLGIEFKLSFFKLHADSAKIILKLGAPQVARSLLIRFSMLWVNSQVNSYGLTVSATNNVGNKLQKFLEAYSLGMAQAAAAMVGQNLGAKKYDRAKSVVLYAFYWSAAVAVVFSALSIFCPRVLFGVFTKENDILALGTIYLRIMIGHIFLSAVTTSFQAMVVGSGNYILNFTIGILDGVICKIGISLILVNFFNMEVFGYFWGTSLSRAIPGIMCVIYFLSDKWKGRSLIKESRSTESP